MQLTGKALAWPLIFSIGAALASPAAPLQPTPLEAFVAQPATHVVWSGEVGRIDSAEAHAVVTALIVEDTAQPPDRMRGIRIDLSNHDARDEGYLGEETLTVYKDALDEISREAARERSQRTARENLISDGTSYVGVCVFWYGYHTPSVHALNAAYYFAPDSSGLHLDAFMHVGFRFPNQDPSQLSTAIARAMDQLKSH